jgi:subtilisin family serine protease
MAVHKTGALRITALDGQLMPMKVEDFGVSDLVPGLRLARVTEGETLKAVAALRAQPDVLYAEPNYIMRATVNPNDTHFAANRQANMLMIGAPTAWNTTNGSASVVVGVLDQGIDIDHQDLQANIWTNPAPNSIPGFTGDLKGYNFVDNNGTVFSGTDGETHASHVAGIIGAVGNNNLGIAGVNWTVRLMSLKFLDQLGSGDTADAISACNYAFRMRNLWETSGHTSGANIRVLNASFGGAGFSESFLDAINDLNTAGILFVAAAGNTTDDGTREPDNDLVPHYPSNFNAPNVISVAAVDQADALATGFSHFGAATVDLAAPGDTVLSTTPHCADPGPFPEKLCQPSFTETNGDTYTFFTGTSMSTPHVSGAAALLWAQNPNLTAAQVKSLLLLNGDVRPTLVDTTLTGRRLNVANSFQSLAEVDTIAPGGVSNFHINSQIGRTLNVGWTASGDDSLTGQAALYQLNFTDGGAVIPLKGLVPMPSGKGQIATVTIPYRHTSGTLSLVPFDNAGNVGTTMTLPVGVQQSVGDPYTSTTGAAAALSTGGEKLSGLNKDDAYNDFLLPFSFPFFGQSFTSVTISTNGALYFGQPPPTRDDEEQSADDVPSSPGKLGGYRAIAGLWDDLDLRTASRTDAGVFQVITPNQIIFRYQAKPCNFDFDADICIGGDDVNFEIELNSNGVIRMRYGSGNTDLLPIVGIGGGGQEGYPIASHSDENEFIDLTNAGQVTFTPRAQTVSTVALSQSTVNANESTGSVIVTVNRSGDTTSVATVDYATSDAAGSALCTNIGSNASSRCDYLSSVGTVKFAAGETSKTVAIPIVNDIYTENPETFTFTLSNAKGVTLGTPASATVTITDGGSEGTSNPIDDPGFFVRQHYIDFLNREPDTGGLNFWTTEITQCGADAQCVEVKRINVSAAFFLSIEFQETGYLVYRIYKTALGNLTTPPGAPVPIAFTDFIRDTQRIGLGVQVNVGDWQNILEANKQAFTLDFVQRPEFIAKYPSNRTATQIVDQMNANAGNVLTPTERTDLINSFGTTPADLSKRAAVLRSISENAVLHAAELRKAFVLMQYFGYMRRSPNDSPDSDFSGFNFWLGKLNDFNGNYINAEMVKAFITSIEYRNRFAP